MRNEQKAELRKIAKELSSLKDRVEIVMGDLDEYISDHQDTLDGTERGEKLDDELNDLYNLQDEFEALGEQILELT